MHTVSHVNTSHSVAAAEEQQRTNQWQQIKYICVQYAIAQALDERGLFDLLHKVIIDSQ